MNAARFAVRLTPDDVAYGFDLVTHASGQIIVAKPLDDGLIAVKVRGDEADEYVVCDATLRPVDAPAKSLDELRRRLIGGD